MSTKTIGRKEDEVGFVILEHPLGEPGEQGEVWLAGAKGFAGVKFVVKISKRSIEGTSDPAYKAFNAEFKLLASFNHPNIVKVFSCDVLTKDGQKYPYYIMEFLGKGVHTLNKAVQVSQGKAVLICLRALIDTADALKHVHLDKGFFHGDIKGSNILVCNLDGESPTIKLIDFGFGPLLPETKDAGPETPRLTPTKPSSLLPPEVLTLNPANIDVWALSYTIENLLVQAGYAPGQFDRVASAGWPIDYADWDYLKKLLHAWTQTGPVSQLNKGDVADFYQQVEYFNRGACPDNLAPDVRGGIRYLSIAEIATAAHILPAFEAIRIPPRQLVLYTERIKELITTEPFGALRYTRQLGLTHLVYPGAQ